MYDMSAHKIPKEGVDKTIEVVQTAMDVLKYDHELTGDGRSGMALACMEKALYWLSMDSDQYEFVQFQNYGSNETGGIL